ncbi:MAG: dihydroorotate dehydrogenase [Alphaproteobacteria bacterium]|nr:dihydroorotate dehydrogenase [Alphaproteobacteria bacterium]
MVDLSVKLGDLTLQNPVMPASGSFSTEYANVIDLNRLGAMVAKTVSRNFRAGNPTPRAAEVEGGMINSIGLPTKGLQYFLDVQLPDYKQYTPPLVASISAEDADDFQAMARDISAPGVDAIEINISCPTRKPGGGNFALQAEHTRDIVRRVCSETDKPVWAKLSPNAGEIVDVALAAEEGGANALTVANTLLAMKINVNSFRPSLGQKVGGFSGPAIKPIIMRMVYQISKAVTIPVIGCGGICHAEDVIEYMVAGATAVEIGYINFRNPTAMISIIKDLEIWCDKRGIKRISDLTGAVRDDDMETDTFAAAAQGL